MIISLYHTLIQKVKSGAKHGYVLAMNKGIMFSPYILLLRYYISLNWDYRLSSFSLNTNFNHQYYATYYAMEIEQ